MDLINPNHNTFLKLISSIPADEMNVFKQLSSVILTNDTKTFTASKDTSVWNSKITDHLISIVNKLPDDAKTKTAVIEKLKFIVKFALETLTKQNFV